MKHTNRKGEVYYLYDNGLTKAGNKKYTFSKNNASGKPPVESIPEGYHIYESPNGQVFLRKNSSVLITEIEAKLAKNKAKKILNRISYIVDISKNIISIYTADTESTTLENEMENMGIPIFQREKYSEYRLKNRYYSADVRFKLSKKSGRLYQTERFCYRGSVDDWIEIGDPGPLSDLLEKYLPHVGKESIFELI